MTSQERKRVRSSSGHLNEIDNDELHNENTLIANITTKKLMYYINELINDAMNSKFSELEERLPSKSDIQNIMDECTAAKSKYIRLESDIKEEY